MLRVLCGRSRLPGECNPWSNPSTTEVSQRQQQDNQPVQPQLASSSMGAETLKVVSRLALTGRYQACEPFEPTPELVKHVDQYMRCIRGKAAIMDPQHDFKLTPPCLPLINTALLFLSHASNHSQILASHQALANLMKCYPESRDCAGLNDSMDGLHVLKRFLAPLIQRSYTSLQARLAAHASRERHMSKAAQCFSQDTHTTLDWQTAVQDVKQLALSNDFPTMLFRQEVDAETSTCTARFLHVRMLLRSEPFFVICEGPARMGAFLRLAERAELHLELLPTDDHVRRIFQLEDSSDGSSVVAPDFLAEVSCSPQNETQYNMLTQFFTFTLGDTHFVKTQSCLDLGRLIAFYRRLGQPFIIQSNTCDLPKVILALYIELLSSHRAVNLMVVGNRCGQPEQHLMALQQLAYQAVNPGTALDEAAHNLLIL